MSKEKSFPNSKKAGVWLWQLGLGIPEGNRVEYPVCPFCTTSPYREPMKDPKLPDTCPECGAKLKQE